MYFNKNVCTLYFDDVGGCAIKTAYMLTHSGTYLKSKRISAFENCDICFTSTVI